MTCPKCQGPLSDRPSDGIFSCNTEDFDRRYNPVQDDEWTRSEIFSFCGRDCLLAYTSTQCPCGNGCWKDGVASAYLRDNAN